MIESIVWLTEGETTECFAGAGMPGPWGETEGEAIEALYEQTAIAKDALYTRVVGDTLYVSDVEF